MLQYRQYYFSIEQRIHASVFTLSLKIYSISRVYFLWEKRRTKKPMEWCYLCDVRVSGNREIFRRDIFLYISRAKESSVSIIITKRFDSDKTFFDRISIRTVLAFIKLTEVIFICVAWWDLVYLSCAIFFFSSEKDRKSAKR